MDHMMRLRGGERCEYIPGVKIYTSEDEILKKDFEKV
jgi:hypothetical protein